MRPLTRCLAAASALLLLGSVAPTAHADDPAGVGTEYVTCPTNGQIDAVLAGTTKSSNRQANGCWYERPTGNVTYQFDQTTLAEARAQAEGLSNFTEFPDLGGFGAEYSDGTWSVTFGVGDDEVVSMVLPRAQKDLSSTLGTLFKDATAPWPGVTVTPKPFTAKCPSAKDVNRIAGRNYTAKADEYSVCNYELPSDGGRISYYIDKTYGSVDESRIGTELSFKFFTVRTFDFGGLGDGAYAWADASPTQLTWQLSDGVVAHLSSWEDNDDVRRLAKLFNDAQTDNGSTPTTPAPSKPGLPSTGN